MKQQQIIDEKDREIARLTAKLGMVGAWADVHVDGDHYSTVEPHEAKLLGDILASEREVVAVVKYGLNGLPEILALNIKFKNLNPVPSHVTVVVVGEKP